MHFGVSMFHTDYSIPAVHLARALEERGFESMWAPEHSHIPVPRRTPFGVETAPPPPAMIAEAANPGSEPVAATAMPPPMSASAT